MHTNSGFGQIELNEDSRPLTTFINLFGRFQFEKMPCGISAVLEFFKDKCADIGGSTGGSVNDGQYAGFWKGCERARRETDKGFEKAEGGGDDTQQEEMRVQNEGGHIFWVLG